MRKVMMIFFALMAIMMMAMPAYAQGGVQLLQAHQLGRHRLRFRYRDRRRLGRSGTGPRGRCSLRSHGPQPCRSSGNSAGADSRPGVHRVSGAVHPGYHLRQGRLVSRLVKPVTPHLRMGLFAGAEKADHPRGHRAHGGKSNLEFEAAVTFVARTIGNRHPESIMLFSPSSLCPLW